MNKPLIERYFRSYIMETFLLKSDIRNFLLNHERKELFINNMLREIKQIESKPLTFHGTDLKQVVTDMTRMFCFAALRTKEEEVRAKEKELFDNVKLNSMSLNDEDLELPEGCISVERT